MVLLGTTPQRKLTLVRSSLGRRRGEERAARSVCRYSMVRHARGTRATGFERAAQELSKAVLPTYPRRNLADISLFYEGGGVQSAVEPNACCRRQGPSACLRIGAARELAACARLVALVAIDTCPWGRALHRREASLIRCGTVVRRASCGLQFLQPDFAWHARARHCDCCYLGGVAALEISVRVRRAGRVVVGPCRMEGHCTSGKPLSFRARTWYDVLDAASTLRSRLSRDTRARATALTDYRDEAQHASLPVGLWSVHAP